MKRYVVTLLLALVSVFVLNPMTARAAEFKDVNVTVMDDMRNFDQQAELTWQCDWSLDEDAGIEEQKQYAKFTLTGKSIVRIKMATVNTGAFDTNEWFRLYGNSTMATPLTDNDINYGKGDDYLLLEAGTYYMECGTKFYTGHGKDNHSTKIMIGAIPVEKAVTVSQVANLKDKTVTITASQKFATQVGKVKLWIGKVDTPGWSNDAFETDADGDGTATFTVKENGWYTLEFVGESEDAFNKDVVYRTFINVDGIKKAATKGKTYTKSNVKYKVTKNSSSTPTGTVTVMGMKSHKSSVTIPATVKINDYVYTVNKIEKKAFYKKSKLKKVTIKATGITSFGKDSFKGIYKKATIYVPKSKYKTYSSKLKKVGVKSPMKIKKK